VRDGGRLGHPGRQESECSVRLAYYKMIDAGVTLNGDDSDQRAAARMKRIGDPSLKDRTPGITTLARPAAAVRVTSQRRSDWR
jgi:hypothetical protein